MSETMGFDKIIGQDAAKRILQRAAADAHPAHAYLFLGLRSTGKLTTAVEFAKALNCLAPVNGNSCDECAVCSAHNHGNFPDLRIWSPDGQNTKIEHMRELRETANFAPIRGKWKINIIEQGDTLNEESANSILKIIEEPPSYLVNIILYRNAASILPTIKSRCSVVRFIQVGTDELAARLESEHGVEHAHAAFLASFSQGCPGKAISLIGNDSFFEHRDRVIKAARSASSGKPWAALKLAEILRASDEKKSGKDAALESLDILALWYRDLLAASANTVQDSYINIDKTEQIQEQAGRYASPDALENAIDAIIYTRRRILGNANPQIATESLMIRLTSAG